MLGRARHKLDLSAVERSQLEKWASDPSRSDRARRSQIVLACARLGTDVSVASELGESVDTVATWRRRFLERRLTGLSDKPRSGRPATPRERQGQLIADVLAGPDLDGKRWTSRSMAGRIGVSTSTVARVWKAAGLSPATVDTWNPGIDPLTCGYVSSISGLLVGSHIRVLAVTARAEAARSRSRHAPPSPSASVVAAAARLLTEAQAGAERSAVVPGCQHSQGLLDYLIALRSRTADGHRVHLLVDNIASANEPCRNWLAEHPLVQVHSTPDLASWQALAHRSLSVLAGHPDTGTLLEIEQALMAWSATLGSSAGAFTWIGRHTAPPAEPYLPKPQANRPPPVTSRVSSMRAGLTLRERRPPDLRAEMPEDHYLVLLYLRAHVDRAALVPADPVDISALLRDLWLKLNTRDAALSRYAQTWFVPRAQQAKAQGLARPDGPPTRDRALQAAAAGRRRITYTSSTPAVSVSQANAIAEAMVERWSDLIVERSLHLPAPVPAPEDYFAVLRYIVADHRPDEPDHRRDDALNGKRIVAHLRQQLMQLRLWCLDQARIVGTPLTDIAAVDGRSAGAVWVEHRRLESRLRGTVKSASSSLPGTAPASPTEGSPGLGPSDQIRRLWEAFQDPETQDDLSAHDSGLVFWFDELDGDSRDLTDDQVAKLMGLAYDLRRSYLPIYEADVWTDQDLTEARERMSELPDSVQLLVTEVVGALAASIQHRSAR
jgi:transposase